MAGGGGGGGGAGWSRRAAARARTVRGLVRDTQRALRDVTDILHFDPEISIAVQEIGNLSSRSTAIVIFGTSPSARARLLHCLLGRKLLPEPAPRGCRWLRIQYGSSTQVHLTLGNSEFELVEELECNKRTWDTLPLEDLIRKDQTDLATILEVELNNSFLKDGLKIVIPPDLTDPTSDSYTDLKKTHTEFYNKRDLILRNFNPVYLYAIDRIGKSVFSESIACDNMVTSRSEEDFWNTFSLYYMNRSESGEKCDNSEDKSRVVWKVAEPSVFTSENCLDLHQIKEINPNSQISFVLFADSVDMTVEDKRYEHVINAEATESTEDRVFSTEELPESDQELVKDGVLRHTQVSPEQKKVDMRRLYEQQVAFMNELLDQWELMSSPPPKHYVKSQYKILDDTEIVCAIEKTAGALNVTGMVYQAGESLLKGCTDDRRVKSRTVLASGVVHFATECMQTYLLEYCTKLSEIHVKLLQQFILASFDMARELQVVPKKIQYVARQEQQLYENITEKFSEGEKKQELVQIMQEVLREMKTEVNNMDWSVDDLPWHQDRRFTVSNSIFYSSSRSSPDQLKFQVTRPSQTINPPTNQLSSQDMPSDGEEAASYDSYNFDDYDIIQENDESLSTSGCYSRMKRPVNDSGSLTSQIGAIRVENESETASMSMSSTMRSAWGTATLASAGAGTCCASSGISISVKHASLDVQQTVLSKLSRKISYKLANFVDCLKDTYFGTLQRCLESLEACCRAELGGRPASEAMRALVCVARRVDLAPCASFSLLRSLLDSLRRLACRLKIVSGEAEEACCVLSPVWRRHVALQTVHSLSPQRLARIISTQILERVSAGHERWQAALGALQHALASRLHHTEDVKLAVRKKYAPSFARLCLESTSMCDLLMYGTPELGREIGRGQYGVVYAVRGSWGGHSPVAVKSVLPADERHYHELAMEFFYTRSIPAHPRIVRLYGSVVQRAGGSAPGVLLLSERRARDLHAAVRAGLGFASRMRISCDIVEGIRYLHSLGLVHRDIKMKNVLLDNEDRAALSDLGFCAAEALISGSVVGTPVHMAPELLAGEYDAAVDVYAFGILFWYVCAGNIKLPSAFELFQNKEQLWSKVKRGLRPERLPHFSEECWQVMEACWAPEPERRALLGDVQPRLETILQQALLDGQLRPEPCAPRGDCASDDDSLDMTGIDRDDV